MGLDMYLYKRTYVENNDVEVLDTDTHERKTYNKVSYIIQEAMYWRKANAIHQWFVKNIQDGKDDFVDEDSRQSLNFRDFLNDDIDTINDVIRVWDSYNKTINIIMDMINELKKCRNFDGVKKTIRENDDEIKDLEQMTKDLTIFFVI